MLSCVCSSNSINCFAGFFACPMHTIFVKRSDSESRLKAMKEIRRRAHDTGHWPTTLIFPEGQVVLLSFVNLHVQNVYVNFLVVSSGHLVVVISKV